MTVRSGDLRVLGSMLRISLNDRVAVQVTARRHAEHRRCVVGIYAHRDIVGRRNHAWNADGFATARGVKSLGASDPSDIPLGCLSGLRARLPRRQPRCEVRPDGSAHNGINRCRRPASAEPVQRSDTSCSEIAARAFHRASGSSPARTRGTLHRAPRRNAGSTAREQWA